MQSLAVMTGSGGNGGSCNGPVVATEQSLKENMIKRELLKVTDDCLLKLFLESQRRRLKTKGLIGHQWSDQPFRCGIMHSLVALALVPMAEVAWI